MCLCVLIPIKCTVCKIVWHVPSRAYTYLYLYNILSLFWCIAKMRAFTTIFCVRRKRIWQFRGDDDDRAREGMSRTRSNVEEKKKPRHLLWYGVEEKGNYIFLPSFLLFHHPSRRKTQWQDNTILYISCLFILQLTNIGEVLTIHTNTQKSIECLCYCCKCILKMNFFSVFDSIFSAFWRGKWKMAPYGMSGPWLMHVTQKWL